MLDRILDTIQTVLDAIMLIILIGLPLFFFIAAATR